MIQRTLVKQFNDFLEFTKIILNFLFQNRSVLNIIFIIFLDR